jgi:hypothetical protein
MVVGDAEGCDLPLLNDSLVLEMWCAKKSVQNN